MTLTYPAKILEITECSCDRQKAGVLSAHIHLSVAFEVSDGSICFIAGRLERIDAVPAWHLYTVARDGATTYLAIPEGDDGLYADCIHDVISRGEKG